MNERELFERLRTGDETAFDTIFRDHYASLVSLAERMLGERATAEEIAQDVFTELWRRRGEVVVESARAYLFRATRNRALNHLRHQKVVNRNAAHQPPPEPVAPLGPAALQEEAIHTALQRAIESLPGRCREVFELSRVHGLTYSEIAAAMQISVKTVEAQMGKALRILRRELAVWLPAERKPADPTS